ncbi:hypothetical protein XENOCAPTIV_029622, partial [Xenoophorus captivus]
TAVAESLGVKLHRTATYHPQANGLCERVHSTMKAALEASEKVLVDRLKPVARQPGGVGPAFPQWLSPCSFAHCSCCSR